MSRTVYTRTTVRDDGTLQDCSVEVSSGDLKLDAYTCALIVRRGKFAPAKWRDGSAAYSVLRFPVNWLITSDFPPSPEARAAKADLTLMVAKSPKGASKIVDVMLQLETDENGKLLSCAELPPHRLDPRRRFPDLVPIACGQAMRELTLRPPLDRSGRPLRSVQTASVQFRVQPKN